jgi:hypothetical protein
VPLVQSLKGSSSAGLRSQPTNGGPSTRGLPSEIDKLHVPAAHSVVSVPVNPKNVGGFSVIGNRVILSPDFSSSPSAKRSKW